MIRTERALLQERQWLLCPPMVRSSKTSHSKLPTEPLSLAHDVSIFGAPPIMLRERIPSPQQLCVDARPCVPLQVESLYSNAISRNELWDPVLIWSDSLAPKSASIDMSNHRIRLSTAGPALRGQGVTALDSVEYTSSRETSHKTSVSVF